MLASMDTKETRERNAAARASAVADVTLPPLCRSCLTRFADVDHASCTCDRCGLCECVVVMDSQGAHHGGACGTT